MENRKLTEGRADMENRKLTEGRADMENRGISSRAKKLKDKYLATPPGVCSERAKIVTQAYQDYESLPAILRRAKVLKRVLEEMSIWIANDELIVGNQAKVARYAPIFPEFSFEWILAEMDEEPFELRDADRFLIDEETKSDLRKIGPYWKGKTVNDLIIGRLPEETAAVIANSAVYTFAPSVVLCTGVGHYSPSYKKVITKGFNGIRQDALEKLKVMGIPADGNEVDTYNFLKAVIISCDAAVSFAQRYADLAKQMAVEESDSARKTELLKIASICEKVPANPATTFHEACQAFWFFQLILQLESSGHSISPGRFDQYMYPYYSKDLLTGQLAREDAQELVECLWIKLSEINKIRPIGVTRIAGGYPMFQNLIVGGQDRDGKDATNDLSFICLDASQNVGLHQPSISARLWNGTPEVFWNKIVEVTKKGLGMPALYNDEVIIPGLLNRGKSIEDARDYAIVGCVEPGPQGYEYGWSGGNGDNPYFSLPACLEYAINDGKSLKTGMQAGPSTGSLADFKSFEEVKKAYEKQVKYFVDHFAVITNTADLVHQDVAPLPFLSCGMEYCIEKGIDVSAGGAKYNAIGTAGVGVSNVGDSLMAIKKMVFDEKVVSGSELLEILKSDWSGQEVLRNRIIAEVPHYGNDEEEVDAIAAWAAEVYCKLTEKSVGPRGPYQPGLYPVSANLYLGAVLGASPDGRKAGDALADGISPIHGRDLNGPTAVLNSASKVDHLINSNGTLLNLKFHPSALEGETGETALKAALKGYFSQKGLHVQYNVVDSKRLRDAQKNPDKYKDLVVRVAGYSALFVGLDPDLQEDIITRTEIEEIG